MRDSRVRLSFDSRGAVASAGAAKGGLTPTDAQLRVAESVTPIAAKVPARLAAVRAPPAVRYVAGVLLLAAIYLAAGRASLALQYTGPVAAIWLPVGVGASTLYLAGLRWVPGVLVGDLVLADFSQPLGTLLGITAGNMADIVVIALLLRRLLGPRAALERRPQVGGLLVAIAAGAAITATVATLSSLAGDLFERSEISAFWRSWFLSDLSGSLVVVPLVLAWAQPRSPAWPRRAAWEGALMIGAVVGLSAIALSSDLPLTYMVFPALIWAALRFGQRGATLAVAVAAGTAVGMTANDIGAFVQHSITDRALSTQLYIAVAALTTLCLAAIATEHRRATLELVRSRARIAAAGTEERRRLEHELHDSAQNRLVGLQIRLRLAQQQAEQAAPGVAATLEDLLEDADAVGDELRRIARGVSPALLAPRGVVDALRTECAHSGIAVHIVAGDIGRSAPEVETAVYLSCLESIQNAAKHAGSRASVTVVLRREGDELAFSVHDTGRGFDPTATAPRAGLTGVRDRIETIGGRVEITAGRGRGTTVAGVVPWRPRAA
jgi:signal transduction histidine kinase